MPIRFKRENEGSASAKQAARRRVTEDQNEKLSKRQVDYRLANFLVRGQQDIDLPLIAGNPIFSHSMREMYADQKMFISTVNSRLSQLEQEAQNTADEFLGLLNEAEQQAIALDSYISESEIKVFQNYTAVHYNSFTRESDEGLGFNNNSWLVDFKTGITFLPNNQSSVIENTGLTLPIREKNKISLSDVILVGEETDVGDSKNILSSSSPKNCLLPNRIFRHVIMRRDHDRTSRKYKVTPIEITMLVEFSHIQLCNSLKITPVGQSPLKIKKLSYINEANEEVQLNSTSIDLEVGTVVLFEPLYTRYLKLTLVQNSPITRTTFLSKDQKTSAINTILEGVGFSQRLDEKEDLLSGRVYDFAISSIDCYLNIYEPLGVFRSKPIAVESPRGLTISNRSAKVTIRNRAQSYGQNFLLPEDLVLNEFYVGLTLRDKNNNTSIRELVPVPNSYPIESEFLPLFGGQSKTKLFPDLDWSATKYKIESVDVTFQGIRINLAEDHNLTIGESIDIACVGPFDHPINNNFTATVLSETEIEVRLIDTTDFGLTVDLANSAYLYPLTEGTQEAPMRVYEDDKELLLGKNFEISMDGGSSWFREWPWGYDFFVALDNAVAGEFLIRIKNFQLDRLYWCEYKVAASQKLVESGLVRLINGRVVFDSQLRNTVGNMHTVVVSRAESSNPYITPILQHYTLKVR